MKSQPKTPYLYKKLQPRPEKGYDEKDVKSKGVDQGLCRNAVDHINFFDNDDPGCKTLRQEKCFVAWAIIIKTFNVTNNIPAQALAAPFWFHMFFITAFSGLGRTLQLGYI